MIKMNKKHITALLAIAVIGMVATSCSKDTDEPEELQKTRINLDSQVESVNFEVTADTIFSSSQLSDAILNINVEGYDSQVQIVKSYFLTMQMERADKILTEKGGKGELKWRSVSYNYWSVDELGNDIKLSARAYWACADNKDLNPTNILLCPHYTITDNAACPTMTNSYEAMFLCGDNLLIMPDYLGFGVTKDHVQPYINHNLCAQNCIDALTAGYKVFSQNTKASLEENFKLCVVGASQGAGNALATHKWLDTHPDFADTWHFAYTFCCAGPYSPTVTFERYFEQEQLSLPCAIPLTLKAMIAAYPDVLGKWTEDDFYSDDYVNNLKPKIDQMIASKEYSTGDLNKEFLQRYAGNGENGVRLSDILSSDALNRDSELCKALFKCLADNDLTKDWTPTHHIYITHDRTDDVVPFANAEAVANAFPNKVSLNATNLGRGHLVSCVMWFMANMTKSW